MSIRKGLILLSSFALILVGASKVVYASENNELNLTSKSAIVMDVETGEVLYEYNSGEKTQIASTTKLMTALLLAENRNKNDILDFTEKAMMQPSTSVYKDIAWQLNPTDKFLASDVMNGLMLKSGNDMAMVIAENIAGDENSFSELMDRKAIELGMLDSDFYTVSGLDTDDVLNGENHFSTAYDMALLGVAAYNNEWIRESMSLKNATMSTIDGYEFELENSNKNLGIDGCVGGKTGYTTKAQRCLVAMYEREDRTLVGVVLGGSNPGYFNDMKKIIDYSFSLKPTTKINKNNIIYEEKMNFKPYIFVGSEKTVLMPIFLKENVDTYINDFNDKNTEYNIVMNDISLWKLDEETKVGELIVKEKNSLKKYDLYTTLTTKELIKMNLIEYMVIVFVIIAALIFCFIRFRKKENKNI